MPDARTTVEIFCSYAHKDEDLQKELKNHLSSLEHRGGLLLWHDRLILPGMDWAREIDEHLNSASVILALISADFLASRYCYGIEMARALERHNAGEALVIPVILRAVEWRDEPIARLQALPTNAQPVTSWSNRDEAFADIAAGIREVLARPTLSPGHAPGGQATWNEPFPRNPFFSGRKQELADLRGQLQQHSATAVSGLGGIGKTQLAFEYAFRHRQDYQFILWVNAGSLETLNASYSGLARLLNLHEKDAREQETVVQAVKTWLETRTNWLLILDNLDEPTVLFPADEAGQPRQRSPFLPVVPRGHVLITTRQADLTAVGLGIVHSLAVGVFTREQGASFLLRRANLLASSTAEEREQAGQITQELGGLPLALDQAGAYLAATGESLSGYLRLYQQRRADLLRHYHGREHPEPVATTWDISFRRVEERNPAAAELLRFCAFLAPEAIPEEILTRGAAYLGKRLAPVVADPLRLNAAIESLRAYSLIARDPRAHTLTLHSLVQAVLYDSLPARSRKQWMQRAVQAVNAAFSGSLDFATWPVCERLLPHALLCAIWIEQASLETCEAACLLNQAGSYLYSRARYTEAEPLLQRALAIRERQLGGEHPATARSLNNLAELYREQGRYEQAEPLYRRALAIRERQLGGEHPDTARSLNNLAELYHGQGRYEQAEPLLQRALAIREQQLGGEHPDTATSLNNLAELYRGQGRYEQAEPLLQRALAIYERQLGGEHPDTATSLNNLATLYHGQGRYEQAEPLLQRALAICERQLGGEHPDTATSLNNLAELYREQGRYEQAEPLYRRALAIYERQLGGEHPATAASLNNLAGLYHEQGRYEQAEPLYRRALAICEQQLGGEHPDTARSLNNLAELYREQGRYEQAEPLYGRALAICERQLGGEHPDTARSLNNLAGLYHEQGRYEQAEPLYRRALAIYERQLGGEHPATRTVRKNYALLLQAMERAASKQAQQQQDDG
jgi:tetratricopeptide (TPR) repeat protein